MNETYRLSGKSTELRRKAEEIVEQKGVPTPEDFNLLSPQEIRQALHDLRVHQIELEMQNEELLRAQVELDIARARYFDLYDLAPVGYCTLSEDGLILETNLTAVNLLGTTRGALLQQPIMRFIFSEDQDIYYLLRKRVVEKGESQSCELRMLKPGRAEFWARLTATVALGSSPAPDIESASVIRLVLSDISERKQAEEEKARLEAQLQQARQLETLGVLAGGVAHDFNNILTAIVSNANLGTMTLGPDHVAAPYFEAIERAAMRAADLNRQLLAFAGKGKYVVTEVDLDIVVKDVIQLLSASTPGNVIINCELADRLPFAKGDSTQMYQILMNLIVNATESFAEGEEGLIIIRTRSEKLDATAIGMDFWPLPTIPGRYVTLEVIDTGAGMTPEVLARAFEPFYSTKRMGRGLGLSAVIGIIANHGGGMRAQSEPGRGSSFKIYLPAMTGERSVPAGMAAPVWRGEGLLLVVDDEPAVRGGVRMMAESLGFTVIEAQDGLEGVERFRLHHKELAVVLLDLTMPRMNGREAFGEMRKIDKSVPVVFSSGYNVSDPDIPVVGLAGFLNKPYRMAEFQGVLQRALAQRSIAGA